MEILPVYRGQQIIKTEDEKLVYRAETDAAAVVGLEYTNWVPTAQYIKNQFVIHEGRAYQSLSDHIAAETFDEDVISRWRLIGILEATVGGSGGASYSQITKLNVTATSSAPKAVELPIANTTTFALPPVEVLKFIPGPQDVVTTACSFDNADADDFTVGGKSGEQADDVAFDGTMRLKTTYDVAVGAPAALADGFVSESEKINFADYKAVEGVG